MLYSNRELHDTALNNESLCYVKFSKRKSNLLDTNRSLGFTNFIFKHNIYILQYFAVRAASLFSTCFKNNH